MNINEKKSFDVIVIGGGAAGMMAAITAASNGADTMILEHKDRVGKKILSTGNGKCNYTNELQGVTFYRGDDPAFVLPVMEQFGFDETVSFFEKLGVYPKSRNGYYYPASEQAASVLDVLRMELTFRHVSVVTECELRNILEKKNGFLLETGKGRFSGKKIIFATGLLAAPKTGSDGSAIPLIKAFGHRFSDVVPALVALQCRESFFKQLAGIRTEAEVSLFIDGESIASERGELQLTDYGISGIPIFQVSRFAAVELQKKRKPYLVLDSMPDYSEEWSVKQIVRRAEWNPKQSFGDLIEGLLPDKLGLVLLQQCHIDPASKAEQCLPKKIQQLVQKIKHNVLTIKEVSGFEKAQVTAGGLATGQVDPDTMESKLCKGLYFTGEILDIDGICGGYNLQWAWTSGYLAGKACGMRHKERKEDKKA